MATTGFYRASASEAPLSVSAREAANVLRVSVSTIERLTRSGALPSVKIGSLRRYRVETLKAFLQSRESAVGGEA